MNTLPTEVAEAFRQAAITAFQELVQVEVFPEDALPESEFMAAVIATINFLPEPPGKFSLVLSENMAATLAARYLPAGTEITTEMVNDVTGEFANVIAGQAKTMLKETSFHFQLSTPVVTRARLLYESATRKQDPGIQLSTVLGAIRLLIKFS